jgi:hypothetical protein
VTRTPTSSPESPEGVPLPRLSDQAAVEIYLFIEHLWHLFESRYGQQISRHFEELSQHNLIEPQLDLPLDDPPF